MPKKSPVWKHFTPVRDDNGNIVGKAKCNYCDDNKEFDSKAGTTNMWRHFLKHFTHTFPDDQGEEKGIVQCNVCQAKLKATSAKSTSSLVQHVEACNRMGAAAVRASRPPAVQTGAPSGFGSSSMDLEPADYLCAQPPPQLLPSAPSRPGESSSSGGAVPDMDEPSKRLAQMIALHGFDPSIVENDGFKSFVESLNPEYRIPKRVKIEDACDDIFEKAEADIEHVLLYGSDCDRFSLAVGKAKIMEREVVYIAYHFIDDEWNLQKVIKKVYLDRPSPYHLGCLDNLISHICVESQLEEAVRNFFSFIDSSFNFDVFMMAWGKTKNHSMLKDCIDQNFPGTSVIARGLVCTTFMDVVFHSLAEHLYLQIDAKFREDMHSTELFLTRRQREKILSQVGVDPWAYKEAWYSWYCSLVVLRNKDQGADSELIRILCNIWGVIYRAIKTISAPKPPTSHLCLLKLLHVKEVLESELALASGDRTINHRGCSTGFIESKYVTTVLTELISILDTAIQESYLVWSIPFVLEPRYNLAGVEDAFRRAFGEAADSYISKSTEHIKAVYSEYLEVGCDEERCQAELDLYLNFYVVVRRTEDFDILNWWKVHGSHHYPTVARMAKDALAMPTSSQLTSEQIAHVKSRLRGYSLSSY